MALDVQAIRAAVYARLQSDAAGSAVRALLGAGAASVVTGEQLDDGARPVRPCVVLRSGPIAGDSGEMRIFAPTWWIYDDLAQGTYRLDTIATAIEAAYARFSIPFWRVTVSAIGEPRVDSSLHLRGLGVTLDVRRRA